MAAFAPLQFIFKIKLELDTFPKNYPASGSQDDKRYLWEHMGVQQIPTSYPQKYTFTFDLAFERKVIKHQPLGCLVCPRGQLFGGAAVGLGPVRACGGQEKERLNTGTA
ncbi:MAG: hypothetical protein DRH12_15610 [Deltaproteobacteria bacterium]|nr:MAG: hypothetical protein DRH12_15610 [Deltaproteobacteria bacterium]RLB77071.1 MAG: hypothetical protein DRH15_11770 [Deltaproteobacteria bacterium]